jgi:hypothetical protein
VKNNPLRFLAGGLTAVVLTTVASGYTYILNSNTGLPVRWTEPAANLRIMLGSSQTNIDGTTFNTSAKGAADTWNALLGSIAFQSTLATGNATDRNRVNELVFASKIYGEDFGEKTLAVTTTWRLGNERTEGDIIFNSARTWDSYPGVTRSGLYDLHRVTLHELGHFLGLDHPDEAVPPQGVSAVMNSRISSLDTLTMDDITGAQNIYGPPGPPENDAYAKATVIGPLDANNKAVLTGFNTLSSKEAGEPNHAGNAGGRSVWWKWTAPASGPVTLDCRDSYYDTTLGVYTGTAVGGLTVVASNDDINPGVVQASTVTFTASTGTIYYFAVDGFDADTGGITLNLGLSPVGGTKPTITTHPFTLTTVVGNNVTLSVTATAGGSALSYQWYFNDAAISGATSATLSLNNVTLANAGIYTVNVMSEAGMITSNPATLTVTAPIVVPPSPPPSSGGGGGGAPSVWFVAALSLVALGRFFRRR